jgi:hypothetical protein
MAKRHDKERSDRYFQIHHYMLKCDAWRALSAPARAVYVQIGSRYNGANNGRLAFSVRDAASECDLAKDTAARVFKELVTRGFIEETRHGTLSKKTRLASEWRLTAFKCDLTGAFKTCTFMHRGGPEYSSYTPLKRGPGMNAPVPINSRECPKQLPSLSQFTPIEEPECPKQLPTQADCEPSPVPNNYPHIIYQSLGTDSAAERLPPRRSNTAAAAPAFDLIKGSFRIGDRRIEVRKPIAAASLTAAQLAQHLADSHPSNADKPVRPRLTVIGGAPTPAIAAE